MLTTSSCEILVIHKPNIQPYRSRVAFHLSLTHRKNKILTRRKTATLKLAGYNRRQSFLRSGRAEVPLPNQQLSLPETKKETIKN